MHLLLTDSFPLVHRSACKKFRAVLSTMIAKAVPMVSSSEHLGLSSLGDQMYNPEYSRRGYNQGREEKKEHKE